MVVSTVSDTAVPDANPAVSEAIQKISLESAKGRYDQALRWADRADRLVPDSPVINEILGRLYVKLGDPNRALKHLRRAAAGRPDPNLASIIIDALVASGRVREGFAALEAALGRFAVEPDSELALCARKHTLASSSPAPGWVGIGPDLTIYGEVRAHLDGGVRLLTHEFKSLPPVLSPLSAKRDDGWSLSARIPNGYHGRLDATAAQATLLGADALFPPDFSLDGRAFIEEGTLKGWVRAGWRPALNVALALMRDGRLIHRFTSAPATAPDSRHQIALDLSALEIGSDAFSVCAELPGGGFQPLADGPVFAVLPPSPAGTDKRAPKALSKTEEPLVDVLVPAYRGKDEVLACIASLLRYSEGIADIIVVDDASPEPELSQELKRLAERGDITLVVNPQNLGFPGAVNIGFDVHPERDVVVLNADAEVFADWLPRLKRAAYSAPCIGTVTPLTNSGTIASYPKGNGARCSAATGQRIATLAAQVNQGLVVDTPTAVGFCMYVRRDCWRSTGPLDEMLLGRGYGEENDFCMRALGLGWKHVVATDVYVRHLEGQSFGEVRSVLMERNSRLLSLRHPQYDDLVAQFAKRDPLGPARRRLDEQRLLSTEEDHILLLGFSGMGGVGHHIAERISDLGRQGMSPLLLQPKDDGRRLQLVTPNSTLVDLHYDLKTETAALMAFLRKLPLSKIELHHFLDLSTEVVDALVGSAKTLDIYLHDYSWICPRITLLGGDGRYCQEPTLQACEACIFKNGARIAGTSTAKLRETSNRWLRRANRVVAPTKDVVERFSRYFPGLKIELEPWQSETFQPSRPIDWDKRRNLKIALIGALGEQKGYSLLKQCAEDALARTLPLEFVVIGYTKDDKGLDHLPNVFVTGKYEQGELDRLIAREAPDIALFASVTPETWCYTLTEALRARLAVVAFDLGAIAERVRAIQPLSALVAPTAGAAQLNDELIILAGGVRPKAPSAPLNVQEREETIGADIAGSLDVAFANESREVEPSSKERSGGVAMTDPTRGLKATVQLLSLKMGLYQFSVKSAGRSQRSEARGVTFPAVQISVAPGVSHDSVQYMTGLRTEGAWLFNSKDLLIAKVLSEDTPVLITSYSAEGLAPLSIEVERVDAEPAPAALAAPRPAARLRAPAQMVGGEGPTDRRLEDGRKVLPLRILTHVSRRGDLNFVNQAWAGAPEQKLSLEGFSIEPLAELTPEDIEYKVLTEKGVETAWAPGGVFCGTRQMNLALLGFSVRVRGAKAKLFECRYRGAFRSGQIVGPATNGTPLRAESTEDALVGIEVYFIENRLAVAPASGAQAQVAPPEVASDRRPTVGPRFSIFREDG